MKPHAYQRVRCQRRTFPMMGRRSLAFGRRRIGAAARLAAIRIAVPNIAERYQLPMDKPS